MGSKDWPRCFPHTNPGEEAMILLSASRRAGCFGFTELLVNSVCLYASSRSFQSHQLKQYGPDARQQGTLPHDIATYTFEDSFRTRCLLPLEYDSVGILWS